jgi:peptidoglycan/LPS O-acetylase OafA/YrhL
MPRASGMPTVALPVQSAPAHRADIDGLRAIAVLSVIFSHAHILGFGGGYVGVDVFFVISGYLITQLIAADAERPLKAWIVVFYIRRARRILPALFATSLIITVPVILLYLPLDLIRFGRTLEATPVMGVNVVVWRQVGGYFQSDLAHVPTAHFWSIAVEEQFYLLYPLVLALICRHLWSNKTAALFAIAAVSFAACVWGSYHHPSANYFLAPPRAWELLLGAVLAMRIERSSKSPLINEALALFGLLLLMYTVYRYDATVRYPGIYALAPCMASAALIQSGHGRPTMISRILSLRPFVFTGLISYSLYLWHFPILTIYSYFLIRKAAPLEVGGMIAVTYVCAILSWRYIETPIRQKVILKSNRAFLSSMAAAAAAILVTGLLLIRTHGLPSRYPVEARAGETAVNFDEGFGKECLTRSFVQIANAELCSYGPQDNAAARGLVWGDSHAIALLPAYKELSTAHHIRLYLAMTSSCWPLLGMTNRSHPEATQTRCTNFNIAVEAAIRRLNPSLVILNANWINADTDLIPQGSLSSAPEPSAAPSPSNFEQGLLETLRVTGSPNRTVCVVLDVPLFNYDIPNALSVARKRGVSEDFLQLSRAEALAQFRGAEADIRELQTQRMLRSVDPKEILCKDEFCAYEAGGKLLFRDKGHLTPAGARLVSPAIDGCFQDMPARSP